MGKPKNRSVIHRTFGKILVETIFSQIHRWINSKDFDIKFIIISLLGKYFNIEVKSTVAQHENLAAKGIYGVRVPLQIFF